MFRRRRPLLGAAMIGGTAYMGAKAGQRAAQNQAVEEQNEYDQNARLAQLAFRHDSSPSSARRLARRLPQNSSSIARSSASRLARTR